MDIALAAVANDSSVEITGLIRLNINSQRTEDFESQTRYKLAAISTPK
jgi:hypothetical protein